jgi:hypothetical protein
MGVAHFVSGRFAVALFAVSLSIAASPAVTRSAWSASANLIYSPVPGMAVGLEYMRAQRAVEDSRDGAMDRIQFSARYDLSFTATSES